MLQQLAQTIDSSPGPYYVGFALAGMLFVRWVVASKRRTRHLVQLIRAVRRQKGD